MSFWRARHEKIVDIKLLRASSVLVAGAGGLGCVVSQLLLRTGVGKLYLVDKGEVDEPDLNRQLLYDFSDIGRAKIDVALEKLSRIAPESKVEGILADIREEDFSLPPDISGAVDCLDNWESRFRLEALISEREVFMVHAGVKEMYGQITTVLLPETPSIRDIFGEVVDEDPPQVYPPLVWALASLQAWEIINALLGRPRLLNKLLILDLWVPSLEVIPLDRSGKI